MATALKDQGIWYPVFRRHSPSPVKWGNSGVFKLPVGLGGRVRVRDRWARGKETIVLLIH